MTALRFEKYEGLGNDFVLVVADDEGAVDPALAARICDRRRGVGADGVLLVLPPRSKEAHARMRVINADGSIPEMCGNGLRCIALHLSKTRGHPELRIETDAGLRGCVVDGASVTVDLGQVRLEGERRIEVLGRSLDVFLADVGNPHAVCFEPVAREDVLSSFGQAVATHEAFPKGVNAGFATMTGQGMDLIVWERGVGPTLACGTGACAAVAIACERGLLPRGRSVPVRLPGGVLRIAVDVKGRATMRGPARHVFSGTMLRADMLAEVRPSVGPDAS